ncbi:MAG: glycosyltransferase family 2 protein [Verrucomicrobia bacterium]|nr:glycosyltransferase family 2 protein [Verrucomicrobiota bacterium]
MNTLISAKIITYNRADKLAATLREWNGSMLRRIPLEILDNCSTDHTGEVIDAACRENQNITTFRHRNNIGGVGNLLRAYERFDADYCWLLCDDDVLHGGRAAALLEALDRRPDAVLVSSVGLVANDHGFHGSLSDFRSGGGAFFYAASFLPGMVFRRSFLDNGILYRCYRASASLYPHAPLLAEIASKGGTLTCLSEPLVERIPGDDTANIKVNWLVESLLPCKFMPAYGAEWAVDFIECMKLSQLKNFLHMTVHYRRIGIYTFGDFVLIHSYLPRRYLMLRLVAFCVSLCPRSLLVGMRKLMRRRPPVNKTDDGGRL